MSKKTAAIRKNDETSCPFGLPIPFACQNVGKIIERLAPQNIIEDTNENEKKKIADANVRLMAWCLMKTACDPSKCPYAAKIFDKHDAVECNYEDTAPGVASTSLTASPFYSQIFSGVGLNGATSYPIGYYADYNISRNAYFGQFSLQGEYYKREIQKLANKIIENAEKEKLAIISNK